MSAFVDERRGKTQRRRAAAEHAEHEQRIDHLACRSVRVFLAEYGQQRFRNLQNVSVPDVVEIGDR